MEINWEYPNGFTSRRVAAIAEYLGYKLEVYWCERINGVWKPHVKNCYPFFVDGCYKGHGATLEIAKLGCVLEVQEMEL